MSFARSRLDVVCTIAGTGVASVRRASYSVTPMSPASGAASVSAGRARCEKKTTNNPRMLPAIARPRDGHGAQAEPSKITHEPLQHARTRPFASDEHA